jgi:hypothetical protein
MSASYTPTEVFEPPTSTAATKGEAATGALVLGEAAGKPISGTLAFPSIAGAFCANAMQSMALTL